MEDDMKLADEHCRRDAAKLTEAHAQELAERTPRWHLRQDRLETQLDFETFVDAIAFVNQLAEIAEQQDHHPDIRISYTSVGLTLTTHRVHGLTRNDFILAAKIDKLPA
jgi:4a-hydroxytetrahydrobiopterin dehydratase